MLRTKRKKSYWTEEEAEYLRQAVPKSRSCGTCNVCCTVMGVADLPKDCWVPCPHCNGGCSIYSDRPKTCHLWFCAYALCAIDNRPDECGYIVCESNTNKSISIMECWPGVFRSNHEQIVEDAAKVARLVGHHRIVWFRYGVPMAFNRAVFAEAYLPTGEKYEMAYAVVEGESREEALAHYIGTEAVVKLVGDDLRQEGSEGTVRWKS